MYECESWIIKKAECQRIDAFDLWYWSFSFTTSPSNEYSELISFRIDWFDILAVQGTLKSLLEHPTLKASINSLALILIYAPILTPIHDYWKNHSFDYTDLCWQLMSLLFNTLWNESMEIKNSTRHLALVEQENCLIPHVLLGSIMLDA